MLYANNGLRRIDLYEGYLVMYDLEGKRCRTLPLDNHTLEFVVQDENFDTDTVLRSGSEFHSSHTKRSVAIDVDNSLIRSSNLGADSCRQTKAHSL